MRRILIPPILILVLAGLASSCLAAVETQQIPQVQKETPFPTPTQQGGDQPTPSAVPEAGTNSLPAEPVEVVFFSEDGVELIGRFFPAAFLDQPIVVLMHWYQGDQDEWEEIAYWLQNRGGSGIQQGAPWLDASWFPALAPGTSYNVLTFTFRNCQGGCSQPSPAGWLLDAIASLEAARALSGVDPARVIPIGASIGGDAAVSSCAALLEKDPKACLGALSFSPGSYLGESFPDKVTELGNSSPPRPVWCFYDLADPDAVVCEEASSSQYRKEGWLGGNLHGMHLITSSLDPLPLAGLVEFLDLVTGN